MKEFQRQFNTDSLRSTGYCNEEFCEENDFLTYTSKLSVSNYYDEEKMHGINHTVRNLCSIPNYKYDGDKLTTNFCQRKQSDDCKKMNIFDNTLHDIANIEWKCKNPYCISSSDYVNCSHYVTENLLQYDYMKNKTQDFLINLREHLARYQKARGTPCTEYTFAALVTRIGQTTGRSLLALFYVIINVAPVIEIFLYILRFVLDKTISIRNTNDFQEMTIKYIVFSVQMLSVYVCLVFIFGFLVSPVVQMIIGITAKIMLYI